MYLPYTMLSVLHAERLSDAGCATGHGVPAPHPGPRRGARASRAHGGPAAFLATWLAGRARPAKPHTAQLP
jgi:hypothetical protein